MAERKGEIQLSISWWKPAPPHQPTRTCHTTSQGQRNNNTNTTTAIRPSVTCVTRSMSVQSKTVGQPAPILHYAVGPCIPTCKDPSFALSVEQHAMQATIKQFKFCFDRSLHMHHKAIKENHCLHFADIQIYSTVEPEGHSDPVLTSKELHWFSKKHSVVCTLMTLCHLFYKNVLTGAIHGSPAEKIHFHC